jgi:hypothetical protein
MSDLKYIVFVCISIFDDIHNKGMCAKQVDFLWEKKTCHFFFHEKKIVTNFFYLPLVHLTLIISKNYIK